MPEIIVNRAAIDYLTLTTFSRHTYRDVLRLILTKDEIEESAKMSIPRYVGLQSVWNCGAVFFGEGVQDGMAHWLISASGGAADRVGYAVAAQSWSGLNVTRFDAQVTLARPEWFKARDFADHMETGEWRGRRRKPVLIENSGDDTVYLGSYKSDRFTRFYVKEKEWLRYETVFKRDYALSAWQRYTAAPTIAPAGLLVSEMVKFPKHPLINYFGDALKDANLLSVQKQKPVKVLSKTYIWLVKSVVPAVTRLLNDHDAGPMTRQLLLDLLESTEKDVSV